MPICFEEQEMDSSHTRTSRTPGACLVMGLLAAPVVPAWAQVTAQDHGSGLTELSDQELGDMRGRYTVGGDQVAWFGVTMISTWQNESGQQLQGSLQLSMDLTDPQRPRVSFQPHVSITATDAPIPAAGQRHISSAGLANVNGMVQGVQVAGDGNSVYNQANVRLRELDPGELAARNGSAAATTRSASQSMAGMQASAVLGEDSARILLQVDGQGAVEQWIGASGMGQSIALATDSHSASNWMEVDIARQTLPTRGPLGQNVAQAITLSRGLAIGY
jgi:hypothetical protein